MNLIDIQIFTLASLTLLLIAHDTVPLGCDLRNYLS